MFVIKELSKLCFIANYHSVKKIYFIFDMLPYLKINQGINSLYGLYFYGIVNIRYLKGKKFWELYNQIGKIAWYKAIFENFDFVKKINFSF